MADSLSILNATTNQFLLNPPVFMAYQTTTATSMANAFTWTSVAFSDTAGVVEDNYTGHSTVTNPSRYVVKVPGTYVVSGVVAFTANATGFRGSRLAKNGTALLGSASVGINAGGGIATVFATPTIEVVCAVNDYIEVQGIQQSGGALNTNLGTDLNSMLYVKFSHQ